MDLTQLYLKRFWVEAKTDGTQIKAHFQIELANNEFLVPDLNHTWDDMTGQITLPYQIHEDPQIQYDGKPPIRKPGLAIVNFRVDPQDRWTDYNPHATAIIIKHPTINKSDQDMMDTSEGGPY